MSINKTNTLGKINVSVEAIASLAGAAATECYGVVGMASQKALKDGLYELLKRENYSRGVIVEDGETGINVDVYIIVGYGMKISEIVYEVQKKVKYVLETTLDIEISAINVYVQGVSVIA